MTQPEQEAREMLAAAWGDSPQWADVRENIMDGGCNVLSDPINLANSIATRALTKALARPTAGIDREALGRLIDPEAWQMVAAGAERPERERYGSDLRLQGKRRTDAALTKADAILAILPAAAKTGERGAAEEAARIFEQAISEGYPTPANKRDQCAHGKYGWEECITCYDEALTEAVAKVRALSQPLPDAPIVSGEG